MHVSGFIVGDDLGTDKAAAIAVDGCAAATSVRSRWTFYLSDIPSRVYPADAADR